MFFILFSHISFNDIPLLYHYLVLSRRGPNVDPAGRGLDSLAAVEFANAISKDFAGLQKLGHRPGEGGPDQVHYILYYIIYTYTVYNYIYILLNHVMCLFFSIM